MDSAVSDLEEAKKALNKNDPGTMISNLVSLHTDCADALEQFGIKFLPLTEVVGRYILFKIQNVTNDILPQITGVEPQTKTSIQSTCKEAVDSVVSDLEEAKKALNKNDSGTMISNLAAFHTDCADALEQFGIKFLPLTEVVGRYMQFMCVALSVAKTQP
ncbi:hypothetical protein K7X08_030849 [Anisodus acutangulus]|uniref:Uncharacterized protein n=1 Tax=Anisodus acutangulus TaxID=402998 RepID=A0A9Q1LZR7_9SOLA|nr:hypothetical protein K7X08_030849 [Anisodus acutangulus]